MRDYKNVKVPRKYRIAASRTYVKQVDTGPSQRKKSAGMKSRLLTVLMVAAVAGGSWLAWQGYRLLTQGDAFQVSGVDVKGVRHIGDAELQSIVGQFRGQNIFRADLQSAVQRARQNPWIKEVRIRRSLPNRISMSVEERVPCAVLDTGAGRYLIDNEAVAIERVQNNSSGDGLPLITARDSRPHPGESVATEGVAEALAILAEIEARGGWSMAGVTVRAGSAESMSVLYGDYEFKFGSGSYDEKLRRLAEIMADVKERGLSIAYVDLRPETQAAVMVKQAPAAKTTTKQANARRPGRSRH